MLVVKNFPQILPIPKYCKFSNQQNIQAREAQRACGNLLAVALGQRCHKGLSWHCCHSLVTMPRHWAHPAPPGD